MSRKQNPIKRKIQAVYRPTVFVYIDEFEDGTYDIKTHPAVNWEESYMYMYDESLYKTFSEVSSMSHMSGEYDSLLAEVDVLLDTLALKQHYPAWSPNDEPF